MDKGGHKWTRGDIHGTRKYSNNMKELKLIEHREQSIGIVHISIFTLLRTVIGFGANEMHIIRGH